ncbi:unnamed protein product [Adineta ricciae]|uniref:Uncharacterized protein n=1 Tax=Adineta ricciae TaxID=249248 RepID=A0A814W5M9_ADIRI|nr:unnamed protein product [Adineta ricciae]CAF1389514.1 unnamed protein product [Adineta ricciae]
MKILLSIFFIDLFIVSIYGDFNITLQVPKSNFTVNNTNVPFSIQISQLVNRPTFSSRICVYNYSTNTSVYQIDVSNSNSSVSYTNYTVAFYLPQNLYNASNEFYITFDVGVLFSNSTINSTAFTDPQFWHLRVIDPSTTTTTTTTTATTTTSSTTTTANVAVVTVTTSTTTTTTTTTTTSQTTRSSTTTTTTMTTTTTVTSAPVNTGEPPPTRSAQLGMGLGITFITIAILAEIIYFKYCYSGGDRGGSYYT